MSHQPKDAPPADEAQQAGAAAQARPKNLLDQTIELDAKVARIVDEARARAADLRKQLKAELKELAEQLDREAEQAVAEHQKGVDARKSAALAALDEQLEASRQALEAVRSEKVDSAAAEVARVLEQGGHGH